MGGGYHAALLTGPLLGTLAVVTFAGLTARLAGARWAPLAALVVALSLPMQYTSRATYSEPLAEILLLGGLALVLDGLRAGRTGREARAAAGLGGLALGLTVLVRIDGVSDVLPVIPFCGAMFVRRRPQAGWLTAGLAAGTAIGVGEGLLFSWPYLMVTNRISVLPLAWLLLVVIVATAAGTWFFRHRPLPRFWGWLPDTALAGAFALVLAFGVRPHFQHVWGVLKMRPYPERQYQCERPRQRSVRQPPPEPRQRPVPEEPRTRRRRDDHHQEQPRQRQHRDPVRHHQVRPREQQALAHSDRGASRQSRRQPSRLRPPSHEHRTAERDHREHVAHTVDPYQDRESKCQAPQAGRRPRFPARPAGPQPVKHQRQSAKEQDLRQRLAVGRAAGVLHRQRQRNNKRRQRRPARPR